LLNSLFHRDELREQHALGEEIASAITNAPIGEPIDEADLEEELEGMEQEAMDERMLKTGTVPVAGEVDRLPQVGNSKLKAQPAEEEDEEEELRKLQAEMAM
jgi:charged multivesicular body protein 4